MSIGAGMDSSLSFSLHATVRRYEDVDKVAAIFRDMPERSSAVLVRVLGTR
jgi:hypothetical protein